VLGVVVLDRDERTVIFCDPDPVLYFLKLGPSPTLVQKVLEIQNPSPNKVQNINKIKLFVNKNYVILFHNLSPNPVLIPNL